MDQYLRSILASHIASHGREPLSELEVALLLAAGLVGVDDVERVPGTRHKHGAETYWRYVGDRWTTALENAGPLLIPAHFRGPGAALTILKRHLADGEDLAWDDVRYLELSGAAPKVDFHRLPNGRWRHRMVPDRVMHVAVCISGPLVLGVHVYADVEAARDTALFFLKTIHGLPEDLSWDDWTALVETGRAPSTARETAVWSVPFEPAPPTRGH